MLPSSPLPPGSVDRHLGGGQLGRMLALAAAQLGFRLPHLAPEDDSPAFQVSAAQRTVANYTTSPPCEALRARWTSSPTNSRMCPAETAAFLAGRVPCWPPVLRRCRRPRTGSRKRPSSPAWAFPSRPSPRSRTGRDWKTPSPGSEGPAVLKTRRFGYDGKGQTRIDGRHESGRRLGRRSAGPRRSRRLRHVRQGDLGHRGAGLGRARSPSMTSRKTITRTISCGPRPFRREFAAATAKRPARLAAGSSPPWITWASSASRCSWRATT